MNDDNSIIHGFRQRAEVGPLAESVAELSAWYRTPMGKALLFEQKKMLTEELNLLFGYHLMQLSVLPESRLYSSSRVNHCFSLAPAGGFSEDRIAAISDFHTLPLADESIDVTILHHALEFSENPQQVLKEAARVTMPRGYIVLIGFNPLSFMGLRKSFTQYFSTKKVWHRHNLRVGRVKDWLSFLDFSTGSARYSWFNLPINNKKYIRNTQLFHRWQWPKSIPFGAFYCLLARKDKLTMTPIKPRWETAPETVRATATKRAIKTGTASSAMILPLRRKQDANKKTGKDLES